VHGFFWASGGLLRILILLLSVVLTHLLFSCLLFVLFRTKTGPPRPIFFLRGDFFRGPRFRPTPPIARSILTVFLQGAPSREIGPSSGSTRNNKGEQFTWGGANFAGIFKCFQGFLGPKRYLALEPRAEFFGNPFFGKRKKKQVARYSTHRIGGFCNHFLWPTRDLGIFVGGPSALSELDGGPGLVRGLAHRGKEKAPHLPVLFQWIFPGVWG